MRNRLRSLSKERHSSAEVREWIMAATIAMCLLFAILIAATAKYHYQGDVSEIWLSGYSKTMREGENISFAINTDSESELMYAVSVYVDGVSRANFMTTLEQNSINIDIPSGFKAGTSHRVEVVVFDTSSGDWYDSNHKVFYTVDVV